MGQHLEQSLAHQFYVIVSHQYCFDIKNGIIFNILSYYLSVYHISFLANKCHPQHTIKWLSHETSNILYVN